MPFDLFVCYSRRDNSERRITQLIDRIRSDFASRASRELRVFFDSEEIRGMDDWRLRILSGLRESQLILACISPSFVSSPHCEWEITEYLKFEIGHLYGLNGICPIHLVPVPGWEDRNFESRYSIWLAELRRRQHFDLRQWFEQGEHALREAEFARRIDDLNQRIYEAISAAEQAVSSPGNIDAPNPHFVVRSTALSDLRANFSRPGTIGVLTALHGMGGLGKTALAIQYSYAFAREYGGGRWQIRCAGKDDLRFALADLSIPLGFEFTDGERRNPDLQLDRVRRELKLRSDRCAPHRCLLVLDNVEHSSLLTPAIISRLNPSDWLHILVTSCLGEGELNGKSSDRVFLAVDALSPDEALALIRDFQPGRKFADDKEEAAARNIVKLLGSFTLAVESAAVYLGQYARDVTCTAFLERLKEEGLEGLETAAGDSNITILHGEKRLSDTLRPTLERLTRPERLVLEFAALLPPDQVSLPWLRTLVSQTFPEISKGADPGYPDPWLNVVRRLLSLRLLQVTETVEKASHPIVRVHRLVQELMLNACTEAVISSNQNALESLIQKRDGVLAKTNDWTEAAHELEPFTALALLWGERNVSKAAFLLTRAGEHWYTIAEWSRSEQLTRMALSIDESTYGRDHPDVARDLVNLALVLQDTNRMAEAEPLLRRALTIGEKRLGPEHIDVADILNNLAMVLQDTNRPAAAERLMRRALKICEKHFGPDHSDVATYLTNLGQLLQARNKLAEAEQLLRRALAVYENNFGPDHPSITHALSNFADLLKTTNRMTEAEPYLRRALAIDEKSFRPNHPEVARDLINLASLLQETNRRVEAEPMVRRALSIDEECFGLEHPDVGRDLINLASLLEETNRRAEAEPMVRRALAIDEKSYGPEHPEVARDLINLGSLLQDTNRFVEAESLVRRALAIDEKSYGPEHPEVARDLINLGSLLQDTNRFVEAESLVRRALAIDEKSYGPEHPEVARDLINLGSLLQDTNRFVEAESLMRRALAIDESSFGPDHDEVAADLNVLASLLRDLGLFSEAETLILRALKIDDSSYGCDHPRIACDLKELALILHSTNKLAEAEPALCRAVEIFANYIRATGHRHPESTSSIESYRALLGDMGLSDGQITTRLLEIAPEIAPSVIP